MASKDKTKNIGLNYWHSADKPVMEDFNKDNLKLDEVLGEINTQLSNKANKSQAIPDGADLNLYTTEGLYHLEKLTINNSVINTPLGSKLTFNLAVEKIYVGETFSLYTQTYKSHSTKNTYGSTIWFRSQENINNEIIWQPWVQVATTETLTEYILEPTSKLKNQSGRLSVYWKNLFGEVGFFMIFEVVTGQILDNTNIIAALPEGFRPRQGKAFVAEHLKSGIRGGGNSVDIGINGNVAYWGPTLNGGDVIWSSGTFLASN